MNRHRPVTEIRQVYRWFRAAAEQGDPYAQFNLGLLYKKGDGVARDDALAATWLRLAAKQGLAFAQNHLGAMYYNGRGVEQDDHEAFI